MSDTEDTATIRKPSKEEAKSLELTNSKPLDVHTWSEHPEVNAFVDPLYEQYFKGRETKVRKKHLNVVLLDLYVTWSEDPTRKIAVSRNPNDYKAGTRYNELNISRLTIKVVDALINADLIKQSIGFYDHSNHRGKRTRIEPTDTLINLFRKAKFSPFNINSHKDRLTVILRDGNPDDNKKQDVEYEPTEETDRMSAMLTRYNNQLASTFIDIPTLDEVGINIEENGKPSKLVVSRRDKFVRRIFNRNSFECGGRFNGGWWQRCPKEWRSQIFINNWQQLK